MRAARKPYAQLQGAAASAAPSLGTLARGGIGGALGTLAGSASEFGPGPGAAVGTAVGLTMGPALRGSRAFWSLLTTPSGRVLLGHFANQGMTFDQVSNALGQSLRTSGRQLLTPLGRR